MVKNDNAFLPIWLKYYSKFFGRDNIYVLDHESSDGSTDNIDAFCKKEIVHHPYFSDTWKVGTIMARQKELLKDHEYVIFTDCDECLAPDPEKFRDLEDFIIKADKNAYRCKGYEIYHSKDEPSIDLGRPLLRQRKYWYPCLHWNKPLISRIPLNWIPGFHKTRDLEIAVTEDLLLIHLNRIDHDIRYAKQLAAAGYKWTEKDIKNNYGWQYHITEPSAFDDWFYNLFYNGGISLNKIIPEIIPDKWKNIL